MSDRAGSAAATYMMLIGEHPADADVRDEIDFDRHVFASMIAVAGQEGAGARGRLGLSASAFEALLDRWFPHASGMFPSDGMVDGHEDEDVALVRDLLLRSRTTPTLEATWLATMIARRAVEPNHLWEDLGLRERGELSRLLMRHFGPLARRNTRNMRWKRFFYRAMCESDGFVMCSTPVCTACGDFDACFGEETGESRLARARRAAAGTAS